MARFDYGAIVRRSFELTKKYKWLWVYGLLIGTASSGGNFNGLSNLNSGGSSSENTTSFPEIPQNLPEQGEKVLGQATDWFFQSVAHVSPLTWGLVALGIALLILFGLVISWVAQSFAKGALISGLQDGDEEKEVTLSTTAKAGIAAIKPLIIFNLIFALIALGLFIGAGIVLVVLFAALTAIKLQILGVLIFLVALVGFMIILVLFAMMQVYADRLIVLKHYTPMDAFRQAWSLSKGNFLSTVVMGIINSVISCGLGCVSAIVLLIFLGIPAIIVLIPSFQNGFQMPSLPSILFLLLLALIGIIASMIFRAAFVVFNFGTWNLFFKEVLSTEGGKNE